MTNGGQLRIVQGPGTGQALNLDGSDFTIGRGSGNNAVHPDPQMSRTHLRFIFRDGGWSVVDLQSSNGTFVNGNQIHSPTQLRNGDHVFAGTTMMVFEMAGQQVGGGAADPTVMGFSPAPVQPQSPIQTNQIHPGIQSHEQHMPAPGSQNLSQNVNISIPQNKNGLWILVGLALFILGPCGLMVFGVLAFALLPFIMVIVGLILGIIGTSDYRRFNGYPGWESRATRGLIFMVGGYSSAFLGLLWIFVAWFMPHADAVTPK